MAAHCSQAYMQLVCVCAVTQRAYWPSRQETAITSHSEQPGVSSLKAIYSRAEGRERDNTRGKKIQTIGKKFRKGAEKKAGNGKHVATFIIAHVHGPFFVPAVVVDGWDYALRVAFCGVLLNSFQNALCSYKSEIINTSVLQQSQRTVLAR